MHLFGKKKKEPVVSAVDAITKLKDSEATLAKRREFMEAKSKQEADKIRQHLGKKTEKEKKAALMCLRRKKMFDKAVDDLDKMTMNLETQIMTLESAKINTEAFRAQQVAAAGLKQIHGEMDIDKVEEIKMDLQEQLEISNEISDALTTPIAGDAIDDDDLLEELEGLEQEMMDESLGEVPAASVDTLGDIGLPAVPSDTPALVKPVAAAMTDEERELAELEASMS